MAKLSKELHGELYSGTSDQCETNLTEKSETEINSSEINFTHKFVDVLKLTNLSVKSTTNLIKSWFNENHEMILLILALNQKLNFENMHDRRIEKIEIIIENVWRYNNI